MPPSLNAEGIVSVQIIQSLFQSVDVSKHGENVCYGSGPNHSHSADCVELPIREEFHYFPRLAGASNFTPFSFARVAMETDLAGTSGVRTAA